MVRLMLALGLIAGCDRVFDFERPPPPEPGTCSLGESLADDFVGPAFDAIWETGVIGNALTLNTVTVQSGTARVEVGVAQTGAYLRTIPLFDLRSSSVSVEVGAEGSFGAQAPDNSIVLVLGSPGFAWTSTSVRGDALVMRWQDTKLDALRFDEGQLLSVASTTYDPAKHKAWKIARDGDAAIWSVSGDGKQFIEMQRFVLPSVGVVRPMLAAFMGTSGSFSATFDRVNGGGTPRKPICPAATLREDFDELEPNIWSEHAEQGCTFVARDGALVLDEVGTFQLKDCFVGTGLPYDLRGESFSAEIASALVKGHTVGIAISMLDGSTASLTISAESSGSQLIAGGSRTPNPYATVPYDPVAHRWLRLRAEATPNMASAFQLYWEVSPDGHNYTFLAQTGDYSGMDRVRLQIKAGGDSFTLGTAMVDHVNLAP